MAGKLLFLFVVACPLALAQTSPHGNIRIDCQACHSTDSWEMRPDASFDHDRLKFPLTGQHRSVDCASCHSGLRFEARDTDCASCHADIHRNELGAECARCHTTQAWLVPDMVQKHQETQFPLLGRHAGADCQSCHPGSAERRFAGTPITCEGCHMADYQATTQPNHTTAGFSTDCEQCHAITAFSWSQGFDHNATAFPLTGSHTTVACTQCHVNSVFAGTPTDCALCHQADYDATTNPNHTAAGLPTECVLCHSTTAWQGGLFDHNQTLFPLTGAHTGENCQSCHGDGIFAGKPTDCVACHQEDFASTQNPSHAGPGFTTDCVTCHSTTGWEPASFDHAATAFPLTGAHMGESCESCHANNNYQLVYTDCFQCHQEDFESVQNPNHMAGNFSHDCTPCHSTTAWEPASFDHSTTAFPLTGAHVTTECQSCHIGGNYQIIYNDCYQCHQAEYESVSDPNHVAGNFNHDCTQCHTTSSWEPSSFDHATTAFPLSGAHTAVQCQSCHVNGNYQIVYTDCYQCHATDFQAVANPNHVAGNFSHDCQPCHTTTAWLPATFDHGTTTFPLTGAHVTTECQSCHVNGNYQLTYTDCYACHGTEYQAVTDPNHVTGNFRHDCQPCHTTTAWLPAAFDHSGTSFPLTGAHVTIDCQSCHVNGNYQLTYVDCYQCHQTDYQAVVSPNHVAGNFSHDCQPCHGTAAWLPATFDHGTTAFPLSGAHVTTECQSCHVGGNYQLTYVDCYQCHEADYQAVVDPNHVAGNFSRDCQPCHTTTGWLPATFDHGTTAFPLTGAHVTTTCQSCHVNGNYQLTYTDCFQCHQADFQAVLEPNHAAGNFGHDCTPCHTTTAWLPSTFDHGQTSFALTGAHTAVACSDCHVNNQYQGTPTDCYSCHQADYTSTTNPNHVAGGFSTECLECHTTTAWSPASFDHNTTGFPLTGAHVTTDCQSCHVGGNYQLVYEDCYQCHQAEYEQPTDPNHVLLQFGHDCTPCHTTTAWFPSTFDHDGQYFRIYSGEHQGEWSSCSECHPSPGNFADFTCISCHEHNQQDMDDEHQDVQGYVYASPACYDCHRGAALR